MTTPASVPSVRTADLGDHQLRDSDIHGAPVDSTAPDKAAEWILPLSVLIVGSFMSVLDGTIVNVAIPKIQIELGASADDVEWVVTGYTLALGVIVPVSGWLGLRIGKTRLYVLAVAGFAAASALCGLAWSLDSLIAFRVLQAVPGGILPVVIMTLLYEIVPAASIGAAMGIYGLGVVVAPAVGPVLGRYLTEYTRWQLIFFINVPIGIDGAILALMVFPQLRPTSWPRFDTLGFISIAYGLFALLLACSEGQSWGWGGYRITALFVSGALSLALFVVIEQQATNPLIDLRILRSYTYSASLVLLAIVSIVMFSALFFLPQFLQRVQGLQELNSGLVLAPAALVLLVLMPVTGRLYDTFGARYLVLAGVLIMGLASHQLAQLTTDTPRSYIETWLAVRNIGMGQAMMPIMTTGISALSTELTAPGSAMNNIVQRVASSVAVAVFGALNIGSANQLMADRSNLLATGAQALPAVAAAQAQGPAGLLPIQNQVSNVVTTETYNNCFFISAILCLAGAALALTLPSGKPSGRAQAAVEMQPEI
jgi:EmrB/QacA subfamily drug resistance transporter